MTQNNDFSYLIWIFKYELEIMNSKTHFYEKLTQFKITNGYTIM